VEIIPKEIRDRYETWEWRNASVILAGKHPEEWKDLLDVLGKFRLRHGWIVKPGGARSDIPKFIDGELASRGWKKQRFETRISVKLVEEPPRGRGAQKAQRAKPAQAAPEAMTLEGPLAKDENEIVYDSPTHEVDMFKNRVAIEVEWNNKTEFYDRDLNNFRLLFDLRVVDVGVIITRSDELRTGGGIWKKFGASSTNVGKLIPRLEGGGGGGCPVLVFAITKKLYVKDG